MRSLFRWQVFIGFTCGLIFSIFAEFALGIPAHIPLYSGLALPVYSPIQVHLHGS